MRSKPSSAQTYRAAPGGGVDYPINGVIVEWVENEHLVMNLDCSEHPADWHALVAQHGGDGREVLQWSIQSEYHADNRGASRTRLTVRTRFATLVTRGAHIELGMGAGWSESFERFESDLARMAV